MFKSIEYLRVGNDKQRLAYLAICKLNILNDLSEYCPILCGTLPIDISVKHSDLDIIMEAQDSIAYMEKVKHLYGNYEGFQLKEVTINHIYSVVTRFRYAEFDFELFAQPIKVDKQHAYLHMIVEHHLLTKNPNLKEEVIYLKQLGMKTEPAFAKLLSLEGNPYDAILELGVKLGIIS